MNDKTAYTPGPWEVWQTSHGWTVCNPRAGWSVCSLPDEGGPHEANARLIAAAPDMLAALKRCEAMVSTDQGAPNWDWVREVIAKATQS